MSKSPYLNCRAVKTEKGWQVVSDFWELNMISEEDAQRAAQIIQLAYTWGAEDLRNQINGLLSSMVTQEHI